MVKKIERFLEICNNGWLIMFIILLIVHQFKLQSILMGELVLGYILFMLILEMLNSLIKKQFLQLIFFITVTMAALSVVFEFMSHIQV